MHRIGLTALVGLAAVSPAAAAAEPGEGWAGMRALTTWAPCVTLILAACVVLAQPRRLVGLPGRAAAVLAIGFAVLWPALAYAQGEAATTVNVGQVIGDFRDAILWGAGLLVAGLVSLLAAALKTSTGLTIDAKRQERLADMAMIGVRLGLDRAERATGGITIEVKNRIVATAIEYIRSNAAAEAKRLKMSDGDLEGLARAKLQEILAQTTLEGRP